MYKRSLSLLILILLFTSYGFGQSVQNISRLKISLNELWQFSKSDTSQQTSWTHVSLPHTWNSQDVIEGNSGYYRGIGWYKRALVTPADLKGKKLYLWFEGANNITDVYVNHQLAGSHSGGYTAFCFDISRLVKPGGTNELLIKVNNAPDMNALPISADYTFYGGIYRDLWLVTTSEIHFDMMNYGSEGVFISTPAVSDQSAMVAIKGDITNNGSSNKKLKVLAEIKDAEGKLVRTCTCAIKSTAETTTGFVLNPLQIEHPHLWSPDDPYLYSVSIKIQDVATRQTIDQLTEPLGLRHYRFDKDKGFYLNGKPLKLMGTNRHQDFQGYGNALTDDMHEKDIRLIKEMGANFIRIAHYPQDPRILEMCDKYGLLVWEEIPVVNEINLTKEFSNNAKTMLTEMIRQNYNHPSVIIWGFMNEVFATNKMRNVVDRPTLLSKTTELAKDLQQIAKKEDPYRSTAMALEYTYAKEYLSTGIGNICDILGWNLYIGWYQENMDNFGPFLDEWHKNFPDKPFIISEYGAGSDVRLHTLSPQRYDYSIEYQENMLACYYKQIMKRDYVAGATVWNSFDFNSYGRADEIPNINNKGLMTANRKYKDSYFFLQAELSKKPILRIASLNWTNRAGRAIDDTSDYCIQPVTVFSNLKQIELFLNGTSLGKKEMEDKKAVWAVPFINGKNTLYAVGDSLNDKLETDFRLQPHSLSDPAFKEIGVRFGSKEYFIDGQPGFVWEPEQKYTKGSWGYLTDSTEPLEMPARFDVRNTDNDVLYYTYRKNMSKIQFDVADGQYEVELLFIDKLPDNEFEIILNGSAAYQYPGAEQERTAVSKKYSVQTINQKGITITFNKIKGDSFLSAVRIRKVN